MGSDPNFECRHPEHLTLLPASFAAAAASWGLLVARQPRVFDGLRDESIDGNFSDILALLHSPAERSRSSALFQTAKPADVRKIACIGLIQT